jgi:hypothetical protein
MLVEQGDDAVHFLDAAKGAGEIGNPSGRVGMFHRDELKRVAVNLLEKEVSECFAWMKLDDQLIGNDVPRRRSRRLLKLRAGYARTFGTGKGRTFCTSKEDCPCDVGSPSLACSTLVGEPTLLKVTALVMALTKTSTTFLYAVGILWAKGGVFTATQKTGATVAVVTIPMVAQYIVTANGLDQAVSLSWAAFPIRPTDHAARAGSLG